jgi:ATP sulfurylase
MRLASGEIWPIPITLATDLEASVGDVVELTRRTASGWTLDDRGIFERDVEGGGVVI